MLMRSYRQVVNIFTERVLRKANKVEKQTILGFAQQLAEAIYEAYNTQDMNNFEDLRQSLQPIQINTILVTFRSLTQSQLDYFNNK